MSDDRKRECVTITFEEMDDPDGVDLAVRIRAVLKHALRAQFLRPRRVEFLDGEKSASLEQSPEPKDSA